MTANLFLLQSEEDGTLRARCDGCGAVIVVLQGLPVPAEEWVAWMKALEKEHAGCVALCEKEESDEQASE